MFLTVGIVFVLNSFVCSLVKNLFLKLLLWVEQKLQSLCQNWKRIVQRKRHLLRKRGC